MEASPLRQAWLDPIEPHDPQFVQSYMAMRDGILKDGAIPAKYKLLMGKSEFLVPYACPMALLGRPANALTSIFYRPTGVGAEGVEPSCSEAAGFKPAVSTVFTTRPSWTS